jgi:Helix-turn-helix domain
MVARRRAHVEPVPNPLPALRFEISEAALILRMSRAQLYIRIQEGSIKPQKDGARTYITRPELERYVESCSASAEHSARPAPAHLPETPRRRPSL